MEFIIAFLANFFATTIGVILAFISQGLYEKRRDEKKAKELKQKIKNELIVIKKNICDIHNGEKKLLLSPIKMPVYQGAINSLQIGLLSKYDWYDELILLYDTLETYNIWHNLKTDKALDRENLLLEIKGMLTTVEKELLDKTNYDNINSEIKRNELDLIDGYIEYVSSSKNISENLNKGKIENVIGKLDK
jgi:hypothetical protein